MSQTDAGAGAPGPHEETPAPITCGTAVRRMYDHLDGALAPAARAEVQAHLAGCERCPPHFDFARAMLAAVREASLPAAAIDAIRARTRHALDAAFGPRRE